MEKFFFFALVLIVEVRSEDPCPRSCSCTLRSAGIAKCSMLDPNVQRFSSEISNLVIKDLPSESNFYLSDKIFVQLGLESVRSIEIINSSLRAIDVDAFHGLKSVADIDLSNNKLVRIPPDSFKSNVELRRLKLSGNPVQLNDNNYFLDSPFITELDLSHCDIFELSHLTFSRLKNIESLILSNNKLKQLDSDVLKPMEFLDELNLSFNQISYISPDTFSDIEDMTTLNLRGNPMVSLQELYLPDLRDLDVSEGNLKTLEANSLEGVPKLNYLNLSHNAIETIQYDAFSSHVDLMYLYLSNNDLRGPLSTDMFEFNRKLEIISFSGNPKLGTLNGFRGDFLELYNYDISGCGLKEISNKTFSGMYFIATLNISNNHLQRLEPKTFTGLRQLSVLDLSGNELHYLPIKTFDTNSNLHKLYLGHNQFHHIPAALFLKTPKLYSLDASYNKLSYLWNVSESIMMESKGVLENLVYLNVAGNRLKRLHLQNVISLKKLGKLDISDNPMECSNSLLHVIEWLILHHVIPNRGMGEHPISITEVNNNLQWDETVRIICPISHNSHKETPMTSEHEFVLSDIPKNPPHRFGLQVAASESVPSVNKVEYLGIEDNKYIWPLTLVAFAGLFLIFALGNIAFLMVYKSRHNYRLISYKSQFPNPLGGLSHLRHKNSPTYQKLYEDCSVPKTPIVKNCNGNTFVVSGTSDADKAEAV